MNSLQPRKIMRRRFAVVRSVLESFTIIALATFVTAATISITKAEEQQSSEASSSKDSQSNSLPNSVAEPKLKTPAKGTNGMSTSSMEYEPMYPADKPDWIFKDPYWNNDENDEDESAFIFHVSGDLEVSEEACKDRRFEGSIDAVCSDLDKYVFKRDPPCKQIPEIVEDLRDILENTEWRGHGIRERGNERFETEGTVLEVNTAEGKRYQLWRKIEISKGYLTKWQFFHNRAYHPERFRVVGVGLLSVLGLLGLTHVGVRTLGRRKTGNDEFLTSTYR